MKDRTLNPHFHRCIEDSVSYVVVCLLEVSRTRRPCLGPCKWYSYEGVVPWGLVTLSVLGETVGVARTSRPQFHSSSGRDDF